MVPELHLIDDNSGDGDAAIKINDPFLHQKQEQNGENVRNVSIVILLAIWHGLATFLQPFYEGGTYYIPLTLIRPTQTG